MAAADRLGPGVPWGRARPAGMTSSGPGKDSSGSAPPGSSPRCPLPRPSCMRTRIFWPWPNPADCPPCPGGGEFLDAHAPRTGPAEASRGQPHAPAGPWHLRNRALRAHRRARKPLQAAFQGAGTRKVYRTLCSGRPEAAAFAITAPIGEVPYAPLGLLHAAQAGGRPSESHVTVLERREGATLVEVEIRTGRPHQIRIHLAWAGHPLVGDPLYGPGGLPLPDTRALPGDPGYLLHAHRLELAHPRTGEWLHLHCQPPPALRTRSERQPLRDQLCTPGASRPMRSTYSG